MKTCLGLLFFEIPEKASALSIVANNLLYSLPLSPAWENIPLPEGQWEIVGEINKSGMFTFYPAQFLTIDEDETEDQTMYIYPDKYYSHITHARYLSGDNPYEVFKAHMEYNWMFIINPLKQPIRTIPFKSPGNYTENDYQDIENFNKRNTKWKTIESCMLKTGNKYLVIKPIIKIHNENNNG